MKRRSVYPEHEKLKKVADLSQACGDFLGWLQSEKGYFLAEFRENSERALPVTYHVPDLLAEYFGIDQKLLEQEKRKMLAECREAVTR